MPRHVCGGQRPTFRGQFSSLMCELVGSSSGLQAWEKKNTLLAEPSPWLCLLLFKPRKSCWLSYPWSPPQNFVWINCWPHVIYRASGSWGGILSCLSLFCPQKEMWVLSYCSGNGTFLFWFMGPTDLVVGSFPTFFLILHLFEDEEWI